MGDRVFFFHLSILLHPLYAMHGIYSTVIYTCSWNPKRKFLLVNQWGINIDYGTSVEWISKKLRNTVELETKLGKWRTRSRRRAKKRWKKKTSLKILKRHQMRYRENVIIEYQIEFDFLCVFAYDRYSIRF